MTMWTWRAVCTVLFFAVAVAPASVSAYDSHKFKTCSQNAFCQRNRDLGWDRVSPYTVTSTPQLINGAYLEAEVKHRDFPSVTFILRVDVYDGGLLRVRVREREPLHERYEDPEVILDSQLSPISLELDTSKSSETSFVLPVGAGDGVSVRRFVLQHGPLQATFEEDGQAVLRLNEHGQFNFEHSRAKIEPTPEPPKEPESEPVAEGGDEAPAEAGEETGTVVGKSDDGAAPTSLPEGQVVKGGWEETFSSWTDTKPHGPSSVSMDVSIMHATHVYGIAEHTLDFALKDTRSPKDGKVQDPHRLYNLDIFEYDLDTQVALYGAVPYAIAMTPKGRAVGVFWHNIAETYADVGTTVRGTWSTTTQRDVHWFSESGNIDVFLFVGPEPKSVFTQYARVTGMPLLPPQFAIAYHQCRWNYKDERDVEITDAQFDGHDIPYDVLWLDIEHTDGKRYMTWDSHHFPNPAEMQQKLGDKGRHMVAIVDPHIKRDNNFGVHTEAESRGLYIKDKHNKDFDGHCWPGSSSWIDFLNPAARRYWADRLSLDNYRGSTKFLHVWNDMNEPSVFSGPEITMNKDNVHYNGVEHREVHNVYGQYMHRATYEALSERGRRVALAEGGSDDDAERGFVLSRAFYAGSQRYGAVWTGDNKASWDHLAKSQPMLLTLAVNGISFSGADVGGFFGNPPTPELLVRWYQAGAFHPFFRAHAHLDTDRREPWLFGDTNTKLIRAAIIRRYQLLPYFYTVFHESHVRGWPVMRPLWAEWPADEQVLDTQDAFMVGDALLVQPVVTEGQQDMQVSLPGHDPWYDYDTGKMYGPATVQIVKTPLSKTPVFIRGGRIIPRKDRVRRSSTQYATDPYTLVVALDSAQAASGSLYLDDGSTVAHATKGSWQRRQLTATTSNAEKVAERRTIVSSRHESVGASGYGLPGVAVERIVVHGLNARPTGGVATVSGKTAPLDLQWERAGESPTLIIRRPNLPADADWHVDLAF